MKTLANYWMTPLRYLLLPLACLLLTNARGQQPLPVKLQQAPSEKKVDIWIGGKLFTSFLYPDSLEKPLLFPVMAASGHNVTRGYPLNPQPGDPTDHPHHIGIWFNYENVNGLDFWNNSFAIPADRKKLYGWIKTNKILEATGGEQGKLVYSANWTNHLNEVQLVEKTTLIFSGVGSQRIIDRFTTITASIPVLFKDVKDGMLGIRLAKALQIPTAKDLEFKDEKGIATTVKGNTPGTANGSYLAADGKIGDSVWSSRSRWCMAFGQLGNEATSVTIIDHPGNPNYPTFWHARGYGLFAANPLGAAVFTNGASTLNLSLKTGESVQFRYRMVIETGTKTPGPAAINELADAFAKEQ